LANAALGFQFHPEAMVARPEEINASDRLGQPGSEFQKEISDAALVE